MSFSLMSNIQSNIFARFLVQRPQQQRTMGWLWSTIGKKFSFKAFIMLKTLFLLGFGLFGPNITRFKTYLRGFYQPYFWTFWLKARKVLHKMTASAPKRWSITIFGTFWHEGSWYPLIVLNEFFSMVYVTTLAYFGIKRYLKFKWVYFTS